jgi:hypothetical protein
MERTITSRTHTIHSIDISDETLSIEQLEKIRTDIMDANVELIIVIYKNHSTIIQEYTDIQKVFEYFKTLETYCTYCDQDSSQCNGGFE